MRESDIPKLRAIRWVVRLPNFLVMEASAIALSADNISSNEIITGKRGANSTHLSMPSNIGVSDLKAAESIGSCQFKYYWRVRSREWENKWM